MPKKKEIILQFEEYESIKELHPTEQKVVEAAQNAMLGAYAIYSKFKVGAAVLLANGEIVTGNNQENAAYPSGMCAERVAIFYANSKFPNVAIRTIAISAKFHEHITTSPVPPCGGCRQVMLETENRFNSPLRILLAGKNSIQRIASAKALLPLTFDGDLLQDEQNK